MIASSPAAELLIQTAVSVLYKNFFCSRLALDIEVGGERPSDGHSRKRMHNNDSALRSSIRSYLNDVARSPWAGRVHPRRRRQEDGIVDVDDPDKHNGKRRSKPEFLRYNSLILQEELRLADDVSEYAQSMEQELTSELLRRRMAKRVKKPIIMVNGQPLKPGKQRKYTKILGVEQPEYSTMSTFHTETVEIAAAVEMKPEAPAVLRMPDVEINDLREKNRYVIVRCRNYTIRPEPGHTFEC